MVYQFTMNLMVYHEWMSGDELSMLLDLPCGLYPFFRFSFPNGSMVQTMARWCLCRLMPCTVAASMFAFDLLHHWTSWWQELGRFGMGCSQLGDSFGHQKWAFEHQQNRFSHIIVTQHRFVQVAVFMGKLMMFLVGSMCWMAASGKGRFFLT